MPGLRLMYAPHRTQMLYEASLRDLPPGFTDYQSEAEIPPEHRVKWG
jgi:hypothetical protein